MPSEACSPMTKSDYKTFATDREVRWCPGCGDYSILKSVLQALANTGSRPENTVFVSGIGCAARMPYYIDTYGFHTIHGRAPAIATGIKLANPALEVWVVTGDGDGLSIGGNHLLHLLRRNIDINLLLFNNETYGLTKGQMSPTSRIGTRSPSTPEGSIARPASPCGFALGSGATFIARGIDVDQKGLPVLLHEAKAHAGTSFVEILQNCIVYNKDVFAPVTDKKRADEWQVRVEHGKPLLFGARREKGLRLNPHALALEVTQNLDEVLVHDETNATLAALLIALCPPLPMAFGVIHRRSEPMFDAAFQVIEKSGEAPSLDALVRRATIHDHRQAAIDEK